MERKQISPRDFSWSFWPILPLYPYGKRRTIRKEVVQDTIWTFDQLQGILYVVVPIRMTVIKLDEGGLLVYAPIAPTPECIRLINELVAKYGNVKYIILPTVSGLEHKVFVGPFARYFPQAQVFIAPNQWSFPLNLPLSWLGFPSKRTQLLPQDSSKAPFAQEFDYAILGPLNLKLGWFGEVALLHKRSHTLLVTDSIVVIPEYPPPIVQFDPYPLLFHAKDNTFDVIEDNQLNRCKGWQRICLFAFYFRPTMLEVLTWGQTFRHALKAPDRSKKAYFGLFPAQWKKNWRRSFDILRGEGHLLVAPILQTLILNRVPRETLDWVNQIASWDFQQIIPCHFESPINTEPHKFRQAFSFLEKQTNINAEVLKNKSYSFPEDDLKLLKKINEILNKFSLVPPPKDKV